MFADLQLDVLLQRAVAEEGYTTPTPIQQAAIPHVLAGKDLLGCAQTGTGKTAAFALPILHRLMHEAPAVQTTAQAQSRRAIRTLILAPTRELAGQILESFQTYGRHTKLRYTVIFGGVGQNPQVAALRMGVDILIATPGRLLDLMQQGHVDLSGVQQFVLDEADNMLDMGFIHDIRKIIPKIPAKRQTLLFSATMPKEIRELADTILREPVSVKVAPVSSAAETVDQCVYFIEKADKPRLLSHYIKSNNVERVLVFARTKHGADRVVKYLMRDGITALAIHGNKSMNARKRAMTHFKSEAPPVLVATDIAARGLDIDDISHVINYDLPNVAETYIHRIGRTGRAGASGLAVSFCDHEERAFLRDIEKLMRRSVPVAPLPPDMPEPKANPQIHAHNPNARAPQGPSGSPRPMHPQGSHRRQPQQGQANLQNRPHAPQGHSPLPRSGDNRQQQPRPFTHVAQPHGGKKGPRHLIGQGAAGGHPRSFGEPREIPRHQQQGGQRAQNAAPRSPHANLGSQPRPQGQQPPRQSQPRPQNTHSSHGVIRRRGGFGQR